MIFCILKSLSLFTVIPDFDDMTQRQSPASRGSSLVNDSLLVNLNIKALTLSLASPLYRNARWSPTCVHVRRHGRGHLIRSFHTGSAGSCCSGLAATTSSQHARTVPSREFCETSGRPPQPGRTRQTLKDPPPGGKATGQINGIASTLEWTKSLSRPPQTSLTLVGT